MVKYAESSIKYNLTDKSKMATGSDNFRETLALPVFAVFTVDPRLDVLDQRSQTRGPRAASGPPNVLMRPANSFINYKTVDSYKYFRLFS